MSIYSVNPKGSMRQLSHVEVQLLKDSAQSGSHLYKLYRSCSLAVLKSGTKTDNSTELFMQHADFEINISSGPLGVCLDLHNAPADAFVDGKLIRNIQFHLFSVLRDILFVNTILKEYNLLINQNDPLQTTNLIFYILRNARFFEYANDVDLIVCWGGHSINDIEYRYARRVGYQLGLRKLNIITGCGSGVMKAPMKGAAVGHADQRYKKSRFIGVTEPSIITAEPPNATVNELLILPDIEKRLEAFVRIGHAIIIFPGGPGTFEELLYLLGIMLNPKNADIKLPIILTGPQESADYFKIIDDFVHDVLGKDMQQLYEIIIEKPVVVGEKLTSALAEIKQVRTERNQSYSFNWQLYIEPDLQEPFKPTHENMANLNLSLNQPKNKLISNLRCLFSGIVAGNIKPDTIALIKTHGPFRINGDKVLIEKVEQLLLSFIQQNRMKIDGKNYKPCYIINPKD